MNFFERLKGNHRQKLLSMVRMALVDGELASAEYEYLLAWAYKENIDEVLLHRMLENQEESESTFGYLSIKKRFHHLHEVALLILADHVVHPKEIEYCARLAEHFRLTDAPLLLVRHLLDCVRAGLPPEEVYRLLKGEKLLR
ncbi:hypothetical protein FHS56_000081 [Thermonema lapsum]|uniref:TerB family tellurite resistance protein n=1 Tax=Thermonema lapsum TaxID=28195 RepID=A0A846MMB9_9BACT|nr:hypothetical protein [Thermonema lapsum]NIK72595.1 hypothetical protein [Thermonema lapsum]